MTRGEQLLIQALREEMQDGFSLLRADIKELSAFQAAHLAMHAERDRQSEKSGVTKRWVIGVAISAIIASTGVVIGVLRLFIG